MTENSEATPNESIKIPACAGSDSYRMTTVLEIIPIHHAICSLLPAWDMMEGENVKAFVHPIDQPLPRGSTPSPIFHRGLCWRSKKL